MKKITPALLSVALLISPLAFNSQVEASTPVEVQNTINQLIPTAPSDSGITTYGSDAPKSSASTHDISVSSYNYQVQKVGAQVYTDKFITGKTSIKLTVYDWTVLKDYGISPNTLTITLYNSSGKEVDKHSISMTENKAGLANFTGLNASTKYYLKFSVLTNEQSYSFHGSIF